MCPLTENPNCTKRMLSPLQWDIHQSKKCGAYNDATRLHLVELFNYMLNLTVGPTPIGVEFGESPLKGKAFILWGSDFQ